MDKGIALQKDNRVIRCRDVLAQLLQFPATGFLKPTATDLLDSSPPKQCHPDRSISDAAALAEQGGVAFVESPELKRSGQLAWFDVALCARTPDDLSALSVLRTGAATLCRNPEPDYRHLAYTLLARGPGLSLENGYSRIAFCELDRRTTGLRRRRSLDHKKGIFFCSRLIFPRHNNNVRSDGP
jgi:hypothetical protein